MREEKLMTKQPNKHKYKTAEEKSKSPLTYLNSILKLKLKTKRGKGARHAGWSRMAISGDCHDMHAIRIVNWALTARVQLHLLGLTDGLLKSAQKTQHLTQLKAASTWKPYPSGAAEAITGTQFGTPST